MYDNFQQNRASRSVKTVYTNLFVFFFNLHQFATCNKNFEKSCLSDMHCPLTDIQADFEIIGLLDIEIRKKKLFPQTTDDRRTDVA